MKIQWKGGALLAPLPPVLVSCGSMEHPGLMTAAWTGIVNTHPPMAYVSIRPERYSYGLIREGGELVINLTTKKLVRAADFCGVRSGRDVDKFAACGLTRERSRTVSCPSVAESPLSLECTVTARLPMGIPFTGEKTGESAGTHELFLCEITAVTVEESLIDGEGKLHLEKCGLVAYAHGEYYALGERLGSFGFSVRREGRRAGKVPRPAAEGSDGPAKTSSFSGKKSKKKAASFGKKPKSGKGPARAQPPRKETPKKPNGGVKP